MAATFNDCLAIQIALAFSYTVHDLVPECPLVDFDHTPLHNCVWHNSKADECIRLLINA